MDGSSGWAEVRAHDRVMRYSCSGAGRAVLLLNPGPAFDALWRELSGILEESHRVLQPEAPVGDEDTTGWLSSFLEGLGVSNVGIVATGPFCLPALELALLEAGQVERVVILAEGGGGGPSIAGVLETAVHRERVPVLVVGRRGGRREVLSRITGFLAVSEAATIA